MSLNLGVSDLMSNNKKNSFSDTKQPLIDGVRSDSSDNSLPPPPMAAITAQRRPSTGNAQRRPSTGHSKGGHGHDLELGSAADGFKYSHGLTSAEAVNLLAKHGRNELPEKVIPKWFAFLN